VKHVDIQTVIVQYTFSSKNWDLSLDDLIIITFFGRLKLYLVKEQVVYDI
jgi:RNA-binding protein YlmH